MEFHLKVKESCTGSVGVTFKASLRKIQTATDGGWIVHLDVPESDAHAMHELSNLRQRVLQIGVVPEPIGGKIP